MSNTGQRESGKSPKRRYTDPHQTPRQEDKEENNPTSNTQETYNLSYPDKETEKELPESESDYPEENNAVQKATVDINVSLFTAPSYHNLSIFNKFDEDSSSFFS